MALLTKDFEKGFVMAAGGVAGIIALIGAIGVLNSALKIFPIPGQTAYAQSQYTRSYQVTPGAPDRTYDTIRGINGYSGQASRSMRLTVV